MQTYPLAIASVLLSAAAVSSCGSSVSASPAYKPSPEALLEARARCASAAREFFRFAYPGIQDSEGVLEAGGTWEKTVKLESVTYVSETGRCFCDVTEERKPTAKLQPPLLKPDRYTRWLYDVLDHHQVLFAKWDDPGDKGEEYRKYLSRREQAMKRE